MPRKKKRLEQLRPSYVQTLDMADCLYGIRAEEIARRCGVDVATARRWKTGKSRIPAAAAAVISGDLGAFSKEWQGWRIQGEFIVSPDQWKVSRNDALAVPLMHGQISALRAKLAELESMAGLEDQPHPDSVSNAKIST